MENSEWNENRKNNASQASNFSSPFSVSRSPSSRRRRGMAILEMAVTLLLLLMLSFGTVEFGYFFYVKNCIQNAAREGARAAIVPDAKYNDVTGAVAAAMNPGGWTSSKYTVIVKRNASSTITSGNFNTLDEGDAVTVTVQAEWGKIGISPLPTAMGGFASNKLVKGAAVMRKEG